VLAQPHAGRPLDKARLGLHYKAALKRADVRPVRIHDLRHVRADPVDLRVAVEPRRPVRRRRDAAERVKLPA
jgi:hypothetical protein